MSVQWAIGRRWAMGHDCGNLNFVHVLGMSRLCPLTDFEDLCILFLDNVWTNIGFLCSISDQGHELGHGLDRTLTGTGQTLYVTAIWTDLGQRFDGDLTNFGYFVQSLSNQPMGRSTQISFLLKRSTLRGSVQSFEASSGEQ